jgi:hypothetical protein
MQVTTQLAPHRLEPLHDASTIDRQHHIVHRCSASERDRSAVQAIEEKMVCPSVEIELDIY